VVAHDWATWHLNNQSKTATYQTLIHLPVCRGVFPVSNRTTTCLPRHCPVSVCHVSATSAYATCHPYSGDTCHPLTGPNHLSYSLSPAMCCHQKMPCQLYGRTAYIVSLPHGTVRTVQSPIFLPVWVFGQNVISFAYKARLMK
jgi:hypothetical protein